MDSTPSVSNATKFQNVLDVRDLTEEEKLDYLMYKISENKKYEMEI